MTGKFQILTAERIKNGLSTNEYDVLRFDQLTVENGSTGLLNIFSVANDGTAGAVAGIGVHSGNNGILFMDQISDDHSRIDNNLGLSSGSWQMVDWFAVDERELLIITMGI